MRLRVAWGGGADRQWHGSLHAVDGQIAEIAALGVEADEPGSLWLEDGRLVFHQRAPRAYDAVDLAVTADIHSRLMVRLSPAGAAEEPKPIEIPLADLVAGSYATSLDVDGNRLLITRSPGDRLRVKFDRESLVFSPGDTFELEAQPHLLGLTGAAATRVVGQLLGPGGTRALGPTNKRRPPAKLPRPASPPNSRSRCPKPRACTIYNSRPTRFGRGNYRLRSNWPSAGCK